MKDENDSKRGPTASGRVALVTVVVLTLTTLGIIYALVMSMR